VLSRVVESIPRSVDDAEESRAERPLAEFKKFRPNVYYSSSDLDVIRREGARVVVLPFTNDSDAKYVGEMVADQLVRHLVDRGVRVVEPGVVRQALLEARQVYPEGPSVPEIDILRVSLNAELVLYGEVQAYREKGPIDPQPYVEFMVRAIDTERGELIWSSASHAGGNKGVFFFGLGHVHTAHELTSRMVSALVSAAARSGREAGKRR
jgi:hypothetical protein